MSMYPMTDIGAVIDYEIGVAPQAFDESGANGDPGSAIDLSARKFPASGKLIVVTGAATGGPTAIAVNARLQHSDEMAEGFADFVVRGVEIRTPNVDAVNSGAHKNVDLTGAKRYVRVVVDVDLTGGTSPTIEAAALLVIGGEVDLPT